jgi:8-oxo-dGTP diphosphatase
MSAGAERAGILLFDGDCAFCCSCARQLQRIGPEAKIAAWQLSDIEQLGVSAAEAAQAVRFVEPDGTVLAGHEAIAAALGTAGPSWRLLSRTLLLPGISPLAAGAYRLVASNRHRLPGGTPACASGRAEREASYPRPMLMADVVALSLLEPERQVLLIRRGKPPFMGSWALPGGFVEEGERALQAASRELEEETGVHLDTPERLELLGVYDTPGRDPRGWSVSVVYLLALRERPPAKGADDASEARWFAVGELPELAFDHASIIADAIART